MGIPKTTDLSTLDFSYLGRPFVHVNAKPAVNSESLDYSYLGYPFVGAKNEAAVAGLNVYVRVAGVWKQATAMYVRVAGVWKSVSTVSTRVSGVWKS